MDKFPKIETIEATFFGQRQDIGPGDGFHELSAQLYKESPEFERVADGAAQALEIARIIAPVSGADVAHMLAYTFKAGVTAERARVEAEQLMSAMRPERGECRCDRDSCDSIT